MRLYRKRVRVAFCESFKAFVSQPPPAGEPAFLISSYVLSVNRKAS